MAKPKIDINTTSFSPRKSGKIVPGIFMMPYESGFGDSIDTRTQADVPEELVGWVKQITIDVSNSSARQIAYGYGSYGGDTDVKSGWVSFYRRPDTQSPQAKFNLSREESKKFFFTDRPWKGDISAKNNRIAFKLDDSNLDPYNFVVEFLFDFRRDDVVSGLSFVSFDATKKELKLKIEYTHERPEMTELQKGHYSRVYHYLEYYTPNGAKIEVEGKGRIITINNFNGDIDFKRGIKLDLWRNVERIFSPIQVVENIKGLESKAVKIQSLEPSDISVNADAPIRIQWAAVNQKRFKITLNGSDYTGGEEKSIQIPAGTVIKGKNTLTLEVFGDLGSDKKTVTFTGYGKPSAPQFDSQTIYNTVRPLIRWTSTEQQSFDLKILEGSQLVKASGEVTTTQSRYQVDVNLKNNTTYTLKLKIKNDRGIWSDEVSKDIQISFAIQVRPATLSVFANNRGVVTLNVSNPTNAQFDYCEIWRKAKHETKWRRIASKVPREVAINDSLLASNTEYEYKVVSYDKQGGSVESEIKKAKIEVSEIEFIDLDTMQDINRGYGLEADAPFKTQRVRDKKILKFEGLIAPVVEIGETDYRVLSFALAFKNYAEYKAFEESADKAAVLLFRSPQGHLIYGQVTDWGDESIEAVGHVTVGFTFTEVAFIQSEIYNAGKTLRVIRLDAGYKLDSGYVLDGEYHEN